MTLRAVVPAVYAPHLHTELIPKGLHRRLRPIALDLVFLLVGWVAAEHCRQRSFWLCLSGLVLGMGQAPA